MMALMQMRGAGRISTELVTELPSNHLGNGYPTTRQRSLPPDESATALSLKFPACTPFGKHVCCSHILLYARLSQPFETGALTSIPQTYSPPYDGCVESHALMQLKSRL